METTQEKQRTQPQGGKRFKLTVKSAEEAVRVIRDKLGEKAKVLSVRQVGGEGLRKFISSPKLEVVAEIPSEDTESGELDVKAPQTEQQNTHIPESKEKNKIKKEHQDKIQIDFKKNIDILKTISNKYSLFTIGFAAETENLEKNAMKKLISKNLNIIAANKVGENLGIDSDENEIILFWGKNNNLKLEKKKKQFLAIEFVEKIFNIMKSEAC